MTFPRKMGIKADPLTSDLSPFTEVFQAFKDRKWIRRRAWKDGYAIQACNDPPAPINIHTTDGFMYDFGGTASNKHFREPQPVWPDGLQFDLLAEDWEIAPDQAACTAAAERS